VAFFAFLCVNLYYKSADVCVHVRHLQLNKSAHCLQCR